MKPRLAHHLMAALIGVAFTAEIHAQTSAFTYQGRLTENGSPATGLYDLTFTLYDSSGGLTVVGGPLTNNATVVSNGLFTVTLDFGAGVFDGSDRWLEIGAVTNSPAPAGFDPLSPRQQVTSVPYAIAAGNLSGPLSAGGLFGNYTEVITLSNASNSFAGSFSGDGSGLDFVDAVSFQGLRPDDFWLLDGNAGTAAGIHFLGTTDNQPLDLRVNNNRALRVAPALYQGTYETVNLTGGYKSNSIANGSAGAVIGGGGTAVRLNMIASFAEFSTIGGGSKNTINYGAWDSTIGGGSFNEVGEYSSGSAINAGRENTISSNSAFATIAGGSSNDIGANSPHSTISGGNNTIGGNAAYSSIGGGSANNIASNSAYATIPGGRDNAVGPGADYAFAAGRRAKANHTGAFVWADSQSANFASTANNQFLVRASGGVGIGVTNPEAPLHVVGGRWNLSTTEGDFKIGNENFRLKMGVATNGLGNGACRIHAAGGIAALYLGANNSEIVQIANDRVGINMGALTNALEVSGDASKATAGAWLANSDARIKRDVSTVTNALETLNRVRLVSFHYTDDYRNRHPSVADRRYLNIIAQEFAEVFPDDVKGSGEKLPDGSQILQADIHPLTIYSAAAIQELNRKVDQKEKEIMHLKARLEKLERLLSHELNGGAQ